MTNRGSFDYIRQRRRYAVFCFVYLHGLIAGFLYTTQYTFSSLMRLLVYPQMSIVWGCLVSVIPFIVFYIFLRCSAYYFLLPLAFLKAFTFMYCFAGISIAYADAGWLVRLLLLFADCFLVPLFLWFAGRSLLHKQEKLNKDIWICIFVILAVRCVDSYVISPFTMKLLLF